MTLQQDIFYMSVNEFCISNSKDVESEVLTVLLLRFKLYGMLFSTDW
jgi:hypothetical protein